MFNNFMKKQEDVRKARIKNLAGQILAVFIKEDATLADVQDTIDTVKNTFQLKQIGLKASDLLKKEE